MRRGRDPYKKKPKARRRLKKYEKVMCSRAARRRTREHTEGEATSKEA